jgi:DEAD/DEAH box helicase domain-containing protein
MLQKAGADHIPVNPSSTAQPTIPSSQAIIPTPATRPSISHLLAELKESDSYRDQIAYRRSLPGRAPQFGELNRDIHPEVLRALETTKEVPHGEFRFYKHQAEAINTFWGSEAGEGKKRVEGKNVVVSTATASGKSVIYQVPTVCMLMDKSDPEATAMFIYPTKVYIP